MMQKLGADIDEGGKQVVVYMPKRFDPAALATLVKQLVPRADISSDPKSRRVVVSASAAAQAMVKSLVDQLDQESALEDTPTLQLYTLEKRMDDTVLPLLQPMVPDAQLKLSTDGRQLTAVARVVDQTVIKKLLDQWKELAAAREEPTLVIYPLTEKLAATDVATLKTLVPGAETTLSTDGRQLRVVARGRPRADQDVDQQVGGVDQGRGQARIGDLSAHREAGGDGCGDAQGARPVRRNHALDRRSAAARRGAWPTTNRSKR